MKSPTVSGTPVWITVKLWRGLIHSARVFTNINDAWRLCEQWREQDFNPDYDDVEVIEASVETNLSEPFATTER
jgi:hypothetical protein